MAITLTLTLALILTINGNLTRMVRVGAVSYNITSSFNEWLVSRKPCTSMHTVVKIR